MGSGRVLLLLLLWPGCLGAALLAGCGAAVVVSPALDVGVPSADAAAVAPSPDAGAGPDAAIEVDASLGRDAGGGLDSGAPAPDAGCDPESDEAFCARAAKSCGAASGTDLCGAAREVASCGSCTSTLTCGGSGAEGACGCTPSQPVVGPVDPYTDLLNLRFNLQPTQVGSTSFEYPNAGRATLRITAVGATYQETPPGTFSQLAVSACQGEFDVPAACQQMASPGGGTFAVGEGTGCPLAPGTYFFNLRFVQYDDHSQTSCVNPPLGYCSNWVKFN